MICENCGRKISDEARFCRFCGMSVMDALEKEPPVHPQSSGNVYKTEIPVRPANTPLKSEISSTSKAAGSVAKTSFPLWAKVVFIIIFVGLFVGGGIFVWNILNPNPTNPISISQTNFVMDNRLVECNDVIYYADSNGLWKKEGNSDSKLLKKCSAINLATNGNVIYYGAYNKTKKYSPYDNQQVEVRQYDMYKYDLKTGSNDKITSFIADGEPICAIGDIIYYTDYPNDFDGNMAGISKGLCSYNTSTGKKEYICDGAHLVQSYDGKIFYRTIMTAGGNYGVHQIHCYDTKTGESKTISDDNVMSFKVISDKLYYEIDSNSDTNNLYTKILCYDIASGNTQTLFDKTDEAGSVIAYDDKYAIYSDDSDELYRVDLKTGEENNIPLSAFEGNIPHCAFHDEDKTVFFIGEDGENTKHIYTVDDSSLNAVNSNKSIYCSHWSSIFSVKNNTVFYDESEENNYYITSISYMDLSAADSESTQKNELNTEYYKMFAGEYTFTSGMGFWSTQLKINDDGTFTGEFHDTNMGESGDGYDATLYLSEFSGYLSNAQKINDYTYSFKLSDIQYKNTPNTEEITDPYGNGTKMLVKYSEAYGLNNTKTIYAYTESAPVSKLPKGFLSWVKPLRSEDTKNNSNLSYKCLYAVEPKCGWIGNK